MIVVLMYSFLMTHDVEHLLMCFFFAICISSLKKCLFESFAYFKVGLFVFLLLRKNCLYILATRPLLDIWYTNIFSQSVGCCL